MKYRVTTIFFLFTLFSFRFCKQQQSMEVQENDNEINITTENYQLNIIKTGFRFEFQHPQGEVIAGGHSESGIQIGRSDETISNIATTSLISQQNEQLVFQVETENGITANIDARIHPHSVKFSVTPDEDGDYTIIGRTMGISPAYGLADHAAFGDGTWDHGVRSTTELTGFKMDPLRGYRMISNFVIFPQQGFAEVNIEPGDKIVRFTNEENVQGSKNVNSMPALYYFIGSPKEIYKTFLEVRNQEGYPVYKPKHEWFGVGWEAFGALAWNTNQKTVTENVDQYLELGYPLEWMVVGSGFWPSGKGEFDEHGTPYGSETAEEDAKKCGIKTCTRIPGV